MSARVDPEDVLTLVQRDTQPQEYWYREGWGGRGGGGKRGGGDNRVVVFRSGKQFQYPDGGELLLLLRFSLQTNFAHAGRLSHLYLVLPALLRAHLSLFHHSWPFQQR